MKRYGLQQCGAIIVVEGMNGPEKVRCDGFPYQHGIQRRHGIGTICYYDHPFVMTRNIKEFKYANAGTVTNA